LATIFQRMDNTVRPTTAEQAPSRSKQEVIREAKRIEEALLYSSKGHFAAAQFWRRLHLWTGIPVAVTSAVAGASALSDFDASGLVAGVLAIIVAVLTGVVTFLNPNDRAGSHFTAANKYDALMNRVRIFWSIDCWNDATEQVLTSQLLDYSAQKDALNQNCAQIPEGAYRLAKKRIVNGEGSYAVDKPTNAR
jgi:hypothetical protein